MHFCIHSQVNGLHVVNKFQSSAFVIDLIVVINNRGECRPPYVVERIGSFNRVLILL